MRIIGLTGPSGVGKDTLANHLVSQGAVHLKYANPLRAMVYVLYDLDHLRIGDKQYEEEAGVTDMLIAFNVLYKTYDPDLMVKGLQYITSIIPSDSDVVVSDVRQPNELDYIQLMGGRVYRLHREQPARAPRPLDHLLDRCTLPVLDLDYHEFGVELFNPTKEFPPIKESDWETHLAGWLGDRTEEVLHLQRYYHETSSKPRPRCN